MAITKPYTFQAGTKARANEVNQDFDILYSEVNRIGTDILNIEIDIQNVAESKANINGNAGQVFKMADAVDSYDGVNKNFLENAIANIKGYIDGFTIVRTADNAIRVSSGSCYDSTYKTMIVSTGNITKSNSSQGANLTYYVHVISDMAGRQVNVLISSQATNPPLPSGYGLYRNIGRFTTDENGKIKYIYQHDSTTPEVKATIVDTYVNGTSGYNIYSNKYCEQWGFYNNGVTTVTFLKRFANINYIVTLAQFGGWGASEYQGLEKVTAVRTDAMDVASNQCTGVFWRACGYIA